MFWHSKWKQFLSVQLHNRLSYNGRYMMLLFSNYATMFPWKSGVSCQLGGKITKKHLNWTAPISAHIPTFSQSQLFTSQHDPTLLHGIPLIFHKWLYKPNPYQSLLSCTPMPTLFSRPSQKLYKPSKLGKHTKHITFHRSSHHPRQKNWRALGHTGRRTREKSNNAIVGAKHELLAMA